jgi:hypothetical protein
VIQPPVFGYSVPLIEPRRKDQSSWAWQSYMGYSFESYSTIPSGGEDRRPDDPDGWSGDVNTNVQASDLDLTSLVCAFN